MIKKRYVVDENININVMDYLIKHVGMSRNKVKSLFKYDNVLVNSKHVKYDYLVKRNDIVELSDDVKVRTKLDIIHEDDDFLIINKPTHLITVGLKNDKSLYNMALEYMKAKTKNNKPNLYVLHRLDMETSGIVVFCKNRLLTLKMQDNWNKLVTKRIYTLVIESGNYKKSDHIELYLKDNDNTVVTVTDKDNGKLAITDYKVLKENKKYALVEANIKTGRKNQIRVTFAHMGYPIIGDKKYYSRINPIKRLALVANELEFINPDNNKRYKISVDVPKEFIKITN